MASKIAYFRIIVYILYALKKVSNAGNECAYTYICYYHVLDIILSFLAVHVIGIFLSMLNHGRNFLKNKQKFPFILMVCLDQKIKEEPHLYEFFNPFMHKKMCDFTRRIIASITKEENTALGLVKALNLIVVPTSTTYYQNQRAIKGCNQGQGCNLQLERGEEICSL